MRRSDTYPVDPLQHPNAQRKASQINFVCSCPLLRRHLALWLGQSEALGTDGAYGSRGPAKLALAIVDLRLAISRTRLHQRRRSGEVARTASSSGSLGSRSSCTTSTTTRMRSRSLEERMRRTSRHRATRLSGNTSCEIISPVCKTPREPKMRERRSSATYERAGTSFYALSRRRNRG